MNESASHAHQILTCIDLGNALQLLGRTEDAIESYKRAVRIDPEHLDALSHLANAQQAAGRVADAMASYRRILRVRPDHPEVHCNLALGLLDEGQMRAAIFHAEQAVASRPSDPMLRRNLAIVLLKAGQLERGWKEYESRFETDVTLAIPEGLARWDGVPREGKRLLLIAEQGFGDAIQFARFGRSLNVLGIQPTLQCDARLERLLGRTGFFEAIVAPGQPFSHDYAWYPLMSLPRVLPLPDATRYLAADEQKIRHWRAKLPETSAFRIGIAWQGNPTAETLSLVGRSIPLEHFRQLADLPVQLVSLQVGFGTAQTLPDLLRFDGELDRGSDAFEDTAALMMSLDLVITCDTAVAHLAGALGREAWVLLHTGSDWRWLHDRTDSPWYPTLRLFRQRRANDWNRVFADVRRALKERLGA